MIKVLIVDDSPTVQDALNQILSSDNDIKVIGIVSSGEEAIEFLKTHKPDVITMDIMMQGINGLTATKKILEIYPIPVIIVSSCYNKNEVELCYKAIEAGAVAILPKPIVSGNCSLEGEKELINTVKVMSNVKVIKRLPMKKTLFVNKSEIIKNTNPINLIAIGASTGGPPVLMTILSGLPADLNVPIVIVQHISKGFLEGMVNWLQQYCKMKINIAKDNEQLLPGNIYFAPDNFHTGISNDGKIFLSEDPSEHGVRPSVSFLFRSILKNCNKDVMAILLTGMGKDGSYELAQMYDKGFIAIAQDKESSVVYGMPGEAARLCKLTHILPPEKILQQILTYCLKR
ncbi:MAG: chemotaxis protein CheB [Thermodesulfovibrionales bacterium]|nr:chemotaxis protein CheB [Thermodesulfovibrionales bacterium]